MQTVNAGGTTFDGQTNTGLEPSVGGNYAVFNAITMPTLNSHPGEFLEASPAANGAVTPSGYGAGSFDASGAAAARAAVGNCSAGQYGTATTTSGLTCAQVAYSQVSGTPSIPSVGTWGALNYPTWASGTPFVKMTAAGTFALDTNTYGTFTLPSLTSGSVLFSNGSTIAQDNSNLFYDATNHRLGIGTTGPIYPLDVQKSSSGATVYGISIQNTSNTANSNTALRIATPGSSGGDAFIDFSAVGEQDWTEGIYNSDNSFRITSAASLGSNNAVTILTSGNVSIGDTAAAAMFNVGTANQFQVTSTGVSSAGAGSTDYSTASSAQVAHCLADGTGGGVCTPSGGTAKQILLSNGTSPPQWGDFPNLMNYPAAICNGLVGVPLWSLNSGATVTCRAGTYNNTAYISAAGGVFSVIIPQDWDSAAGAALLTQTVQVGGGNAFVYVQGSCMSGNGPDDVAFSTTQTGDSYGPTTIAGIIRNDGIILNSAVLSGCVPGGTMLVKVSATLENFYGAQIDFPRLLRVPF
jgi:hypothetical protein